MENFELLGSLARDLHQEFRRLFYIILPLFFAVAVAIQWFRQHGNGSFLDIIKRAAVATLLLVGFQEITDAILFISSGIADRISDMRGLDSLMKMASQKAQGYTMSGTSLLLAFDDLIVAVISYLSFLVLYVARYIMIAVYHFSWAFLSIIAPMLLLFHVFTPKITLNLFRSMIEISCWKIVWATLSAILWALPFGNAFMADGNYLTVIVINFVIALCMLGTPLVVKSLVGSGFSSMASGLAPLVGAAMVAAPAKAATATKVGRKVLSDTAGFGKFIGGTATSRIQNASQGLKASFRSPPSPERSKSSSHGASLRPPN